MKALVLRFAAGFALAFASAGSALAQATPYSATYATYYDTVAASNCVGSTSCTFTFAPVPTFTTSTTSNGGDGILTVSRVNCRFVATNINLGKEGTIVNPPFAYAALGKTSNAAKLLYLTSSVTLYPNGISAGYSTYLVDQTTQFFVQAGGSPTITVTIGPSPMTGLGVFSNLGVPPLGDVNEPTCSVSGLIE
jgi:hypothetical protein